MITPPLTLNGFDVHIARPVKTKSEVKRSWKERLFTLPFHPLRKTKTVESLVDIMKDGEIVRHGNKLSMTEKTWHELKNEL